jgi:hypothetical protein
MNMLSKQRQQFLKLIMRESVHKSFGKYILSTVTAVDSEHDPNNVGFHMLVPHSLCRSLNTYPNNAAGTNVLATSTLLAIFDELSTNNLMVKDKSFRGGVSLHLTTEVLHPIVAEQEVVVKTTSEKIGAVVGFCSMELWNKDRSLLLARGKHIKFMPHGRWYTVITHPVIIPVILGLYNQFKGSTFETIYDNRLFNSKHELLRHDVNALPLHTLTAEERTNGYVFQKLGLQRLLERDRYPAALEGEPDPSLVTLFLFTTHPLICNQLGALHGGAVATIAEEACGQARKDLCQKLNISMAVEKMESRYLNSMKVSKITN